MKSADEDAPVRVGRAVAARRTARGASQAELAKVAAVDVKTLRSLEQGDRWPQDVSRRKIERALDVREGWIDALLDDPDAAPGPVARTRPAADDRRRLADYSDTELIVELATRLGKRVTVREIDRATVRRLPTVADDVSADPLLLAADRGPNEGARRRAELDRLAEHPDDEGPEHGA